MPRHVIVDGSNIATEGRSQPSLKQLNEAVMAFMAEHPKDVITVIVDATFGHRIDPKEAKEFDRAVEHNELVTPPAGTVGRGDGFVLSIAQKVGATILSNDSYQEFHGDYPWLFDEGRLVGGKPVPHVGWVFVMRTPVRGEKSRKATHAAKKKAGKAPVGKAAAKPSAEASKPMPVPKTPPPNARFSAAPKESAKAQTKHVNEILPFLHFCEKHKIGSKVVGVVESYSSHGAYVSMGDLRGYVPLRLLGDPPPRAAREVLALGQKIDLEVVQIVASRRSIDLKPHAGTESTSGTKPAKKSAVTKAPAKKTPTKNAAVDKTPVKKVPAKKTPAKKAPVKKAPAKKTPVKKAAVKKVTVKKTPVKKTPTKTTAAPKKSVATKATAKKSSTTKAGATKTPVRKTASSRR
jgi:predicted RNA-binding protein with RPS1 domain